MLPWKIFEFCTSRIAENALIYKFSASEGRNFTIISISDGQNSRVTFQKSANAREIFM